MFLPVPSVFDKRVTEVVAREVEEAAYRMCVARRERALTDPLEEEPNCEGPSVPV